MKTLKLFQLHFDQQKKSYRVSIGFDRSHFFQDKKAAKKFLADSSRFATDVLFNLNEEFSETFKLYRQNWITLSPFRGSYAFAHLERTCQSKFNSVTETFDLIFNYQRSENNSFMMLTNLLKVANYLQAICKYMCDWFRSKKQLREARQCEFHLSVCTSIANDLQNFGKRNALEFRLPIQGEFPFYDSITLQKRVA